METKVVGFLIVTLLIATVLPVVTGEHEINDDVTSFPCMDSQNSLINLVYLTDAGGHSLSFRGSKIESEFYECYFHIPVAFEENVPFYLDVRSEPVDALIDYKIVSLTPPNLLVCATCKGGTNIEINWTCYVFVTDKSYVDMPSSAPFPLLSDLPMETRQFLMSTDSCQSDTDVVMSKAQEFKDQSDGDLITFTNLVIGWIGSTFPYTGVGDAYSSIKNQEATCTGCAHSAVALCRAVGIPARTLLSMPSWGIENFDCHWIMEFYLPDYGWVRCDPIGSVIGDAPYDDTIVMACYPQDEFCLLADYPGMDGYWHASDPLLSGYRDVNWGRCHGGHLHTVTVTTRAKSENAYRLSNRVWLEFTECVGRTITNEQKLAFNNAVSYQEDAKDALGKANIDGFITSLQSALDEYQKINLESGVTTFFDDFEGEDKGWIHGGTEDEWEYGTPSFSSGPQVTHSGTICWGVDLDDTYERHAKCWLKSPPIDLSKLSSATLNFWMWSLVVSPDLSSLDHTVVYISGDGGETLNPISGYMYGGYTGYQIGGWTMCSLDITRYVDDGFIEIYFEFESDGKSNNAGVYIDDVQVIGIGCGTNIPPDKPNTPTGPTSGRTGVSHEYSTSASDQDGDDIKYGWDWNGDGTVDEWTGFYISGVTATTSHSWSDEGTYQIKVKTQDINGAESGWSDSLSIEVPKNKLINTLFLNFMENHPRMFPILRYIIGI